MTVDRARVAAALPGYELGDQIGAGAFGLVLSGRHRHLQRDVAIKVLAAGRQGRTAGFAAEAVILADIDVLASTRRGQAAARRFFIRALSHGRRPVEVTTDKARSTRGSLTSCSPKPATSTSFGRTTGSKPTTAV